MTTVSVWCAAFLVALVLRRGIRWHMRRWLMTTIQRLRPDAARRPRRLLVDPLTSIIPTRRLFT